MITIRLKNEYARAADLLRSGELVAVPTETVYGLAGNGLDISAVEKIYDVKGRPAVKPLSLMVHGPESIDRCCVDVPHAAFALVKRFWPGPLTIVMKAADCVPEIVRAGGETVALRCPDHPATLTMLKLAGFPFAAPSANPSGCPSPKTAEEVLGYFDGRIAAVVDGGRCDIGTESTIVDLSSVPFAVLRKGALSEADLWDALVDDMKIIGFTGGSGCGKTTALMIMKSFGAKIIDCDALYHELLQNCTPMLNEIRSVFGSVFTDGQLDRKALGNIVFHNPELLVELNHITHRYVADEIGRQLQSWAKQGGCIAAIDAVSLIESGISDRCDFVFAVTAPREDRMKRIMEREGLSEAYASARIDAQKSNEWYAAHCDQILENAGTLGDFEVLCREKISEVLS